MYILVLICLAAMSENYIVFIEQPIKLELLKFMLYRVVGKSFHKVMSWNPELETIFHVANRHTGQASESHNSTMIIILNVRSSCIFFASSLIFMFYLYSSSRQNTTAAPCSPSTRLMHMKIMASWFWTCAVEMMAAWLVTLQWRTLARNLERNLMR